MGPFFFLELRYSDIVWNAETSQVVWGVLITIYTCITHTPTLIQDISIPLLQESSPGSPLDLCCPSGGKYYWFLSPETRLASSRTSYKWTHRVHTLLGRASSLGVTFEFHLCYLRVSAACSLLLLKSIPLYEHTSNDWFIFLLTETEAVSSLELLGLKLLWTVW